MQTIKHIISAYGKWIGAILAPLGIWGVFAFAAVDGAFMGLPLDAIVASYIYKDPHRFLLYVLLAALGSTVGSIVLYVIGYTGGEVLLRKRLSPERFQKIHASFEKHEFLALLVPVMMPPPTPLKAVMLAAAVFEMSLWRYLLAIFSGRMLRFLILGLLTLKFGPTVVELGAKVVASHFRWVLLAVAVGLAIWLIWRRQAAKKSTAMGAENTTAV
ncbi:MAG: DedA family protein [Acidobacteria bacterium]|nr:DedA family protein [Acidobacteriota bacterium]